MGWGGSAWVALCSSAGGRRAGCVAGDIRRLARALDLLGPHGALAAKVLCAGLRACHVRLA